MTAYLVDTDILIDVLRGAAALRFGEDDNVAISTITRAELFAGRHIDEGELGAWLEAFTEHPVDPKTAEDGGRLRRHHPDLRLPDALIAATAHRHDRRLVTRNVRDFAMLDELDVGTPDELLGGAQ